MSVIYSECVLVELCHPAANAHAPYCHLWPVWVYHILSRSHKEYHFRGGGEDTENKMRVLVFSTTFDGNIFYSKNNLFTLIFM